MNRLNTLVGYITISNLMVSFKLADEQQYTSNINLVELRKISFFTANHIKSRSFIGQLKFAIIIINKIFLC